jgi:hypothetical protein
VLAAELSHTRHASLQTTGLCAQELLAALVLLGLAADANKPPISPGSMVVTELSVAPSACLEQRLVGCAPHRLAVERLVVYQELARVFDLGRTGGALVVMAMRGGAEESLIRASRALAREAGIRDRVSEGRH